MYGILLFFKLCIDVLQYTKHVTLRVGSLICNLDFHLKLDFFLLLSHSGVSHPAWHPPSHNPVIQSHFPGALQFSLHLFSQCGPNHPNLHSVKNGFFHKIKFILFAKKKLEYPTSYQLSFSTPIYFYI